MAKREYIQRRNPPVQPSARRRSVRKKAGPPPIFILALVLLAAIVVGIVVAVAVHRGKGSGESASSAVRSLAPASQVSQLPSSALAEEPTPSPSPETEATPPPEQIPVGTPEQLDSLLRVGDTGYEYYNFVESYANEYITLVANAGNSLGGATLYDLVIPTSMDVMLSEDYIQQNNINSSNQKAAINYLYSSINAMNPSVKTVELFDALKLHNNEYIYFRTDHHWTQLGAYYAYAEFCKAKGVDPVALEDFGRADYDGFLGSFYSEAPNAEMENHPDTVEAYFPQADTTMTVTQSDGEILEDWPIIQDGTDYGTSMKYLIYTAGDQPYEVIVNNGLNDGSACLVVKESFGNCFIPFLVNHYQTVYVVDYRHYGGDISDLAAEKGVQDVLLVNNISMTRNEDLIDTLANRF